MGDRIGTALVTLADALAKQAEQISYLIKRNTEVEMRNAELEWKTTFLGDTIKAGDTTLRKCEEDLKQCLSTIDAKDAEIARLNELLSGLRATNNALRIDAEERDRKFAFELSRSFANEPA